MRCLPDLIAWSSFGVTHVDRIVMNILVVEINTQKEPYQLGVLFTSAVGSLNVVFL